jgi:2-hydroxy-6-oxonona-2,4-dienedioate hydrolase
MTDWGQRMDEDRYRAAERRLWTSVGMTPTEERLPLARTGVTVRVQEVGEGPPVVFVHGGSNGGSSWVSLAARLEGFRCLLLDRPGCGLSEPLPGRLGGAELREVARNLVPDVLDALGLGSVHVVATSYGGFVALHGAAAHPSRFERMVLLGWPVGAPIARVPMVMRIATIRPLGRVMTAIPPSRASVRALLRRIGLRRAVDTGRFTDEMLEWYLALLRDTDTLRNELRSSRYLSLRHGLFGELIIPDDTLASIRTPLRFVWGEDDPFGGAEIAHQLVDRMPGAQLELVPAAGHAVWVDELERTAAAITEFLAPLGDGARPRPGGGDAAEG